MEHDNSIGRLFSMVDPTHTYRYYDMHRKKPDVGDKGEGWEVYEGGEWCDSPTSLGFAAHTLYRFPKRIVATPPEKPEAPVEQKETPKLGFFEKWGVAIACQIAWHFLDKVENGAGLTNVLHDLRLALTEKGA